MTSIDPATPTHGNYHNYHGYFNHHAGSLDPRLALLPRELILDARVLDVGCNEGWVTCQMAQIMGARRVVGVDIDDTLVRMAWKRRRALWSFQEPFDHTDTISHARDKKRKHNERDDEKNLTVNYFPASCQHVFGPLPVPPVEATVSGADEFPHNVSFRKADWVNEVIPEDADAYDVIVGFSVAKWIHLNGGDEGLKKFFRRVYDALAPGGTFVFEPQQWESYTKARKLDTMLQDNAQQLELRPDDFGHLLEEIGFSSCERLGEVGKGRFRRPVELYRKN